MKPPSMPALWRLALLAACLAGSGLASGAEPVHARKPADKAAHKHAAKHARKHTATHTHTHTPAQAGAHAHKAPQKTVRSAANAAAHAAAKSPHKPAHKLAHDAARKPSHERVHAAVHESATKSAQLAAHAAALAARPAASHPPARPLPRLAAVSPDPHGDGFLNLYVELCVKRIGQIDAFHDKLLRDKVPKLQPDSAKPFLSGMAGDAWPVPYQGRMGNFVLVLPRQKNLCMLYARRTDTAAVEQGFAAMVAKPPEPMIASRGPQSSAATAGGGATRTVSTSWAPPGSERRMQFMLTTTTDPNAQVQAFGSVAIVVGPEPGPGPERAAASPVAPPLRGTSKKP